MFYDRIIPVIAVERIIKKAGAERVSADATETLAGMMEEYGSFLAKEAKKMSDHAGREDPGGSWTSEWPLKCSNNVFLLPILKNSFLLPI